MEASDKLTEGFNAGYLLQKYEPELANKLIANFEGVESPYIQGVVAGAKEYQMEKELDKSNLFPGMEEGFLQDFSGKDQEKDLEEPDIDMDI